MSPVSILQIYNCLHLLKQAHTLYSMYKIYAIQRDKYGMSCKS